MGAASRIRLRQPSGIGKGSSSSLDPLPSHNPSHISSVPPVRAKALRSATATRCISDLGSTAHGTTALPAENPEGIIPEIIVKIDDMDFIDMDSDADESAVSSPPKDSPLQVPVDSTPSTLQLPNMTEETRTSFASSMSALSDVSDISTPSATSSSKATTPVDTDGSREAVAEPNVAIATATPETVATPPRPPTTLEAATIPASASPTAATQSLSTPPPPPPPPPTSHPPTPKRHVPRRTYDVRPKVSVPPDLAPQEYAVQCIAAAESSRLNPYALHEEEYSMLRNHISYAQVTTYLNIRNGILRLWVRSPGIAVDRDEAIGCAKDSRWFDVANVCYDWLVRRGYINFGCVEIKSQQPKARRSESPARKRRKVIVIGAGMSGLGCARQLDGLFKQYAKSFDQLGEDPPEVVVLEGRKRVGGRVYSRAFNYRQPQPTPGFENTRATVEMGGMIITGFDRGNPMNVLVRGQLGLGYHALRSDTTIYDSNGRPVDPVRDQLAEQLYNDCLDRVSEYKFKTPSSKLIEGNRDLMDEGRDSAAEGHKTIAFVEEATAALPHSLPVSEQNMAPQVDLVPVSSDRLTGKTHFEPGTPGTLKAAYKAKIMGWKLNNGVTEDKDLNLDLPTKRPGATLGSVMDEAIAQYSEVVELRAQDYRLINWHVANLEYSNAINYNQLSLQGWDIDAGNEWEGKHTMVVGGYQAVPRGLMNCPEPLTVRLHSPAVKITHTTDGSSQLAKVECEDGEVVEADFVVSTIPLGVLKHGNVSFDPPLPSWKTDAIQRLGFGVLNKVILVYKTAFWDKDRDIFGVLRDPLSRFNLSQKEYSSQRGRFFQWFNVSNTTGLPCLVALMAGDAAFDTERSSNDELVREATQVLRSMFGSGAVPEPVESVVTRWASDKFARGSYSSAGPDMMADDYDVMSRPIGNLYFAGEHTTGTHPATVHGAYLSGLRAASEVVDAMLGPIDVPTPLITPKESALSLKRKALEQNKDPRQARLEAYEVEVWDHIHSRIGDRPFRPAKVAAGNAYLLFSKVNYEVARKKCEGGRRPGKGKPLANEVRVMTSKMWKDANPDERRPFEEQAEAQKKAFAEALKEFNARALAWDLKAVNIRTEYEKTHPSVPGPDELEAAAATATASQGRRSKKVESYAEGDSDVEMDMA